MSRDDAQHSKPIPINTHGPHARRARAHSVSESSSSDESCSPSSPVSPLQSPLANGLPPRIAPVSPGASPILNYFLSQSPKSANPTAAASATFPFRRGFGTAVFDDDSETDIVSPTAAAQHGRRATTAWAGAERFAQPIAPPPPPAVSDHTERAAGLLRRLSLGGSALRPQVPQIKTSASTMASATERAPGTRTPPNSPAVERMGRKTRRSQTLAPGTPRPKRAPSPMGERILTGHFDGFN